MSTSGSNTTKPATEGVKVIRRRRAAPGAEEPASSQPAGSSAPHSDFLATKGEVTGAGAVSDTRTTETFESLEVKTPSVDLNVEARSEQVVTTPVLNEKVTTSEISKTKIEELSVETKEVESVRATVPQTQSTSSPPKKAPLSAGGATIVRRATPEEIEASKARASSSQAQGSNSQDPRFFRGGRKEDSRGTRVTNFVGRGTERQERSSSPRGEYPQRSQSPQGFSSPAPIIPSSDPFEVDEGRNWSRKKEVRKKGAQDSEEELSVKKVLLKKGRDENINAKRLLAELAMNDDDFESESPAEVEAENIARTVYTPSASSKRRDLKRRKDLKKTKITTPRAAYRQIRIDGTITVGELAHQMSTKSSEVIKKLMTQGVMATLNQSLDFDTATLIAQEFGFETLSVSKSVEEYISEITGMTKKQSQQLTRPPIVTVMGHVDHGKTSILDAIRNANVARGEAGGITQHIGAYTVEHNKKKIAFLDTPGHAAFSNMRARGAKVTDIVVLVVAADDGVMPQTIEAISHAKSANVPIIVAVNKIDKSNINIDRVYTELTEYGIQSEEWGGETQFVKVSALKKTGISELLEAILLQAEVLDLKSSFDCDAEGTVVEAHLDKGRGPIATVMVQKGTLNQGDFIVAGFSYGKVRSMVDHAGQQLTSAGPSTPVQVIGLGAVPLAGDQVNVVEDERLAKEIISKREQHQRASEVTKSSAQNLDDLLGKIKSETLAEVAVIVKADTQGSVEAISESLAKLTTPKVTCKVIHKAVGGITEGDVNLALATKAFIIAFNVRASRSLEEEADKKGTPVKYFSVIYDVVDAIKAIMAGKLPPIVKEVVIGHAQVRTPFMIPKIGLIAGSAVLDGKITRASLVRLVRDEIVIYSGKIGSLRRFKDDVKEVQTGYECGIGIDGYNDVKEGDIIEAYILEESPATLE